MVFVHVFLENPLFEANSNGNLQDTQHDLLLPIIVIHVQHIYLQTCANYTSHHHKHANSSKDDIKLCKMSMHKTRLEFWGKKKLMTFCGIDEVV